MPPQTNASHKTNNQPVILSGENCEAICVVEILPSESEVKSRCVAPQGYGSKSRWLSKGDVTFSVTSHPNSKPYPIVAFAPRFCSVYHFAKLRLRKPQAVFSAQNDIQKENRYLSERHIAYFLSVFSLTTFPKCDKIMGKI